MRTQLLRLLGLLLLIEFVAPSLAWERQDVRQRDDIGVRIIMNWPETFDPAKITRLIIYTCPNGNTAEQTLGCKLEKGMDWHFDIQHVAAQVRKLRKLDAKEN